MQYNVSSPAEYLATIEADWRKDTLLQLRAIILERMPTDFIEGIAFKMLRYGNKERSLFHLNAQKKHVGLYVGNVQKIDATGKLLTGLDCGKGCIRFKKSNRVVETQIVGFIEEALRLFQEGIDLEC